MARHANHRILRQLLPMALVGLTASLILFGIMLSAERESTEVRFRQLAEQRILAIRADIAIAQDSIALLSGHFAVAPPGSTDRVGFSALAQAPVSSHAFIQEVSWDPRVPLADRPVFEESARRDGLEGFVFTERTAEGATRPAGRRDEYIPIYFIEPITTNAKVLGFDLASHPVRRQMLESARDKGVAQATGRITLVQEQGDQFGVLILAPVFGPAGPRDVDSNRRNLTGYVSGVFRIGDLIASSAGLGPSGSVPMIDIHLFDMDAPPSERRLFPKGDDRPPEALKQVPHVAESFAVAGRRWQLLATPSPSFVQANRPTAAYAMLAVSLMATLFSLFCLKGRIAEADSATLLARTMAEARRRLAAARSLARLSSLELDPDAERFEVGEGAAEMLDLPQAVTAGSFQDLLGRIHPDDRATMLLALRSSASIGLDREFRLATDGGAVWLRALADIPANGRVPVTLQDITSRKAAEVERTAMIARIAEADRLEALGTLAGGIAHEINTPTQYVGDNIAFLREGVESLLALAEIAVQAKADPERCAQAAAQAAAMDLEFLRIELPAAAAQALDGVTRIAKIVQAIKEFSYPSSKEPRPIDLNHLIGVVATVTRNQWKYLADMTFDTDPFLPKISAVEGEINQVLVNLIVNATQAIAEKGEATPGTITVSTRALDGEVELEVGDTGIGIPPKNQRRIFEMFFTTKPPGQGTGQGLAITRAIVHRHGGKIAVDSSPGKGSRFTVRFPIPPEGT